MNSEATKLRVQINKFIEALRKVAVWETPDTGKFHQDTPITYERMWGSKGVQEYFREVARRALDCNREDLEKSLAAWESQTTRLPIHQPMDAWKIGACARDAAGVGKGSMDVGDQLISLLHDHGYIIIKKEA